MVELMKEGRKHKKRKCSLFCSFERKMGERKKTGSNKMHKLFFFILRSRMQRKVEVECNNGASFFWICCHHDCLKFDDVEVKNIPNLINVSLRQIGNREY